MGEAAITRPNFKRALALQQIPVAAREMGQERNFAGGGVMSVGHPISYLAFVQLASIRLWLRVNESTP
jgi:hypothetical protein